MPSSAFTFSRPLKPLTLKIIKNDGGLGAGKRRDLKANSDIDFSIYCVSLVYTRFLLPLQYLAPKLREVKFQFDKID